MNGKSWKIRLASAVLLFAGMLLIVNAFFAAVGQKAGDEETELVRRAVRSAALTCYAVEGAYPFDLEYLTERYGLVYDRDSYLVVYDVFASNVMPDIRVLERGNGWK